MLFEVAHSIHLCPPTQALHKIVSRVHCPVSTQELAYNDTQGSTTVRTGMTDTVPQTAPTERFLADHGGQGPRISVQDFFDLCVEIGWQGHAGQANTAQAQAASVLPQPSVSA